MRKLHYAWIVAAVTFATLLVSGAIRATPGLLIVPLEQEFHWSRATISFAVAVNILMYGAIGPFAASMLESYGLRRMMLMAMVLIATGVALTPLMREPWQLVVLWGVVVGGGTGMAANVLAAVVAVRWFSTRRGLVTGVLTASAAAGQLLFLPLFAAVISHFGWRAMALTLTGVALLLLVPIGLWMRNRPEDIGLRAYGEAPDAPVAARAPAGNAISSAFATLKHVSRKRDFWLIAASFFVCGLSTNGLIGTHLIPMCSDRGITEMVAASMLASMAIFNFIGATGSGWLSDRYDPRKLLLVYYTLRGISLVVLPYAFDSFFTLLLFTIFYGLDWIATAPPTVRLIGDAFGKNQTGVIYGWVLVVHQIGGASAAWLGGVMRVNLGSYTQAFVISGVLCFVAAVVVMLVGRGGAASGRPMQLSPQAG
ncbi:MFS transporter [Ramlibacter sp.]|uniref:MFS transporter n=1 Tax=Ramlibacter sp. TaxID=1917967 RepID=UPI003D143087